MTQQEAKAKVFKVKWQIGTCLQGEECWCRTISPEEPILFKSGEIEEEYYIIGSGEINKETAEYLVKLHNQNIKQMSKQTAVKFSMYQWLIGNTRRYCNSCNQIQYHSCDQLRGYTCKCGANKLMDYFLEKYK